MCVFGYIQEYILVCSLVGSKQILLIRLFCPKADNFEMVLSDYSRKNISFFSILS